MRAEIDVAENGHHVAVDRSVDLDVTHHGDGTVLYVPACRGIAQDGDQISGIAFATDGAEDRYNAVGVAARRQMGIVSEIDDVIARRAPITAQVPAAEGATPVFVPVEILLDAAPVLRLRASVRVVVFL